MSLTVTDQGGATGSDSKTVTVTNVAPANVTASFSSSFVNVAGNETLAGGFTDPGSADTHTVVIHWADGSADTSLSLAAGVLAYSSSHQYIVSPSGNVTVTVTDKDGGAGGASLAASTLTVRPSVYLLNPTATGELNISGNAQFK